MSKYLYRWGRVAARHPWRMIAAWLVIAIAVFDLQITVGGETSDDFTIPGTEAQQGIDLLADRFPREGGVSGRVVFADPDGDITDPRRERRSRRRSPSSPPGPDVLGCQRPVRPRQRGGQRRTARSRSRPFATASTPPGRREGEAAEAAVEIARDAGLQAELSREIVRGSEEVEGQRGDRARPSRSSCCSSRSVR